MKANFQPTNINKIFWSKSASGALKKPITKGDVIEYYRRAAARILPYLKNRPMSLHRHPDGIKGKSFFQKNIGAADKHPKWIKTTRIYSPSDKRMLNYLVCTDVNSLLYMANLGCIEMNPWLSRVGSLDRPDYTVIDLDPEGVSFGAVIKVAQQVKRVLDEMKLKGNVKTSGATGMHIFIPTRGKYTYAQSKNLALKIAQKVNERLPELTSLQRLPKQRRKKVYLDYLQNSKGQTMASAYSLRPRSGAPVSMPLKWSEVKAGLRPDRFTIENMGQWVKKTAIYTR